MIQLFHAGGASDFTLMGEAGTKEKDRTLLQNVQQVLTARGLTQAAELLQTVPFRVMGATNHFNDDFAVLYTTLPLKEYERLRQVVGSFDGQRLFNQIAQVISELGPYIRFIAAELALEKPSHPEAKSERALKPAEIHKLVYKYIGVNGGYLADFTYRSHHEFYIELDLPINPNDFDGTTRERFIKILGENAPEVQAKILEGVLRRFPGGSSELRTQERVEEIQGWIQRLRSGPKIEQPALRITSEVVERALLDAQELLRTTGAVSGVDRLHTVLHGYIRAVCGAAGIQVDEESSVTDLFKHLRENHPAFKDLGPRPDEINKVIRALATIVDALNPLRNKTSVAHPNPVLLSEPEAVLVINSVRTILHYLDEKIFRHSTQKSKQATAQPPAAKAGV